MTHTVELKGTVRHLNELRAVVEVFVVIYTRTVPQKADIVVPQKEIFR